MRMKAKRGGISRREKEREGEGEEREEFKSFLPSVTTASLEEKSETGGDWETQPFFERF
jgi:hypothetical protein